uniref:Putative major capsid subunit n=1 Tax=viral metagenome TaxID=1070528 RepID=A0A6M3KKN1_9ZZZZ
MPELLKLMEGWESFITLSEIQRPVGYEKRLKETIDLLTNARHLPPHKHEFMLREALTTSDFPFLFGDVLDRQVLAAYKAVDPVWRVFTKAGTVRRIFPQTGGYRFAMTGGDQLLAEVAEKGEYLASERDETRYAVYVKKYGRQFDISWEAIINDDLGALQDTPQRFARAAVRTEHRLVSATYVNNTIGAALHTAGGGLYGTLAPEINQGALPLTIANLETCVSAMVAFRDANGEPILNRARYLVVGPSMEFTARQILTSATKMWLDHVTLAAASAATIYPMPMANVISQYGLTLVVDPYMPIIDGTNLSSWYLFADPADIAALEVDTLQGHERPEICMKASDKINIAGGAISPMDGDFATDNIFYRVRDVFGCNRLDWRATYANILA